MPKRPFIRKQKRKRHGVAFWDHAYAHGGTLKLSSDASDDFEKFLRWLNRQDETPFDTTKQVVDLGCGNGRNLIHVARELGISGVGFDISTAAIAEANRAKHDLPLTFYARTIAGNLPLEDSSTSLALDMMSSHFLSETERTHLRDEIHRILIPGGWFFMKTFLRDGDLHSERLLKERAAKESGSYIHPVIGVSEHVYTEEELRVFLEERFIIHKVYRSHKHISHGQARKRRTISVYAQRDPYAR